MYFKLQKRYTYLRRYRTLKTQKAIAERQIIVFWCASRLNDVPSWPSDTFVCSLPSISPSSGTSYWSNKERNFYIQSFFVSFWGSINWILLPYVKETPLPDQEDQAASMEVKQLKQKDQLFLALLAAHCIKSLAAWLVRDKNLFILVKRYHKHHN